MIEEFETQLVTAILGSPVVYIPHFHYEFVDEVLRSLVCPEGRERKIIPLELDEIEEFDNNRGIIDFSTKEQVQDTDCYYKFDALLKGLIRKDSYLTKKRLFLFKNIGSIWSKTEISTYIQQFASMYERDMRNPDKAGGYHPLTTLIIVSPEPISMLPTQLEKVITVVDLSAPSQEEIMREVCRIPVSREYSTEEEQDGVKISMCRTLQGLQLYEVYQILRSATIRTGGFLSKTTIRLALEEKKQIVKKSGIVEVIDADVKFSSVGGLKVIKNQLEEKKEIFQNLDLAIDCKLPLPKGVLILGMPGCGKSMIAKSVANLFNMSLLRLDINRLMGQYVGQSEANLRRALETAEAAHPCVLWIDEIEKAFAGSNNGGNNDMLVMRLMGHFLTWMQERKTPVYIVATANDAMRPEFMRKGRFDEVYFVDFPTETERKEIFKSKIDKYKDSKSGIFDFSELKSYDKIAKEMVGASGVGFSGAEIENLVNVVMNKSFVEYIAEQKNNKANGISTTPRRKITEEAFLEQIEKMKYSVISNQAGTTVDRIRKLKKDYNFPSASKED